MAGPKRPKPLKLSLRALRREQRRQAVRKKRPQKPDWRPETRGDCLSGPRPCPFIGCKYHLGLEVRRSALVLQRGIDFESMTYTCALDVADEGQHTSMEVAELLGMSRQRVSQIEMEALAKMRDALPTQEIDSSAAASLTEEQTMRADDPARADCYSKRRYPNAVVAENVRRSAEQARGATLRSYACRRCGGYHLTKQPLRGALAADGFLER